MRCARGRNPRCGGRYSPLVADLRQAMSRSSSRPKTGARLLVPTGFAHAFITLTPDVEVLYKTTAPYSAANDRGVAWDDPDIEIVWPSPARRSGSIGQGSPMAAAQGRAGPVRMMRIAVTGATGQVATSLHGARGAEARGRRARPAGVRPCRAAPPSSPGSRRRARTSSSTPPLIPRSTRRRPRRPRRFGSTPRGRAMSPKPPSGSAFPSSISRPTTSSTARSTALSGGRSDRPDRGLRPLQACRRKGGRAACENSVILRTAWVYSPFGANFVRTMLRLNETRDEVGVVADQRGNPTSALDIADALIAIAARVKDDASPALRGVFHMTGSGEATWADFAETVFHEAEARGRRSTRVKRIATADYPTPPEGRPIPASTTKSLLAYTASGCRNGASRSRPVAPAFCHDRRTGRCPGGRVSGSKRHSGVLMQRKVLVTGGAGFIGSAVCRRLVGRGRRGAQPRRADLCRQSAIAGGDRQCAELPLRQGRHLRPARRSPRRSRPSLPTM